MSRNPIDAFCRARCCALIVLSYLCLVAPVGAELSPESYARMQQAAPEQIQLKVLSVSTVRRTYKDCTEVDVTVEARVLAVQRSVTGLRLDQRLVIHYEHCIYRPARPGPSQVPLLEVGTTYPAFLEKAESGATYQPAAGGRSFESLPFPIKVKKQT